MNQTLTEAGRSLLGALLSSGLRLPVPDETLASMIAVVEEQAGRRAIRHLRLTPMPKGRVYTVSLPTGVSQAYAHDMLAELRSRMPGCTLIGIANGARIAPMPGDTPAALVRRARARAR